MKATTGRTFSISVVLGMLAVGVVSFAAFILLSAFADDLRTSQDGGPHALSKSAVGFAGIVSLLRDEGRPVEVSRSPLRNSRRAFTVLVLTPGPGERIQPEKLRGVWDRILIVLPKWEVRPDGRHPGWVRAEGTLGVAEIDHAIIDLADGLKIKQSAEIGNVRLVPVGASREIVPAKVDHLQTISGPGIDPLLSDENGGAVLALLKSPDDGDDAHDEPANAAHIPVPSGFDNHGPIYVLADPDLLNTRGLASIETTKAGLAALNLVSSQPGPVVFDMTLHGLERSRNVLKLMFEPPFLPAILCLAFCALLIAIGAFAGAIRKTSGREIALGKKTLVENMALLMSLTGRNRGMGQRYVAMTRALAAASTGLPARLTEQQQTELLDETTRQSAGLTGQFSKLAAETADASTPNELLQAANRLFRWRQEIGREHRRR
jgi:hypothetical protein